MNPTLKRIYRFGEQNIFFDRMRVCVCVRELRRATKQEIKIKERNQKEKKKM